MKMQGFLAATIAAAGIFFYGLQLHGETAEEMLSACRPIVEARVSRDKVTLPGTFDAGTCWGAFGALQQVWMLTDENGKPALHACIPTKGSRTELIAIYVRYVESHPKTYPKNFALIAVNAMIQAFPCKAAP